MTEASTRAYAVPPTVASRQLKVKPAVLWLSMCHMQPKVTTAVPVIPFVMRETL